MQSLTFERVRDELDEIEQRTRQLVEQNPTDQDRKMLEEWPAKQQRLDRLKRCH